MVVDSQAQGDRGAASSSRMFHVSTEMFETKERFSAFREEFVRRHLAMDVIDHSGGRPRADATLVPLGQVDLMSLDTAPAEFIRDWHHLKDGRGDALQLGLVRIGSVHFGHAGNEHTLADGSGTLIDQGRRWRAIGLGHFRFLNVAAAALRVLVPAAEDLAGRPVRPGPALHLLDGYLHALAGEEAPPPALAPVIGGHLLDLVAAVLGPSRDAADTIERRGARAARLRLVLKEIAARFGDPGFNVDALARAAGLSRRYVQGLLEETGKSFTEHVLERRLERAFTLLTDPRSRHLSIIDVACASGFGDVSHFNRMFRRRHGDTPTGVRGNPGAERNRPGGRRDRD